MNETPVQITYFQEPGYGNTQRVLQIAKEHAEASGIRQIVVASTTGETGRRARGKGAPILTSCPRVAKRRSSKSPF